MEVTSESLKVRRFEDDLGNVNFRHLDFQDGFLGSLESIEVTHDVNLTL